MTPYSDFIILLARQRSGTNAVRSVLESHPDVWCFNEVFSVADRESTQPFPVVTSPLRPPETVLTREINFFNFQEKYARDNFRLLSPEHHEGLFLDFLEYLRCFSPKRFIFVDVKYNTTHFLTEPYKWDLAPYLYFLIRKYELRVLNLTRKHYLRAIVSNLKAQRSGRWSHFATEVIYDDGKIRIDPNYLLAQLRHYDAENQSVETSFRGYHRYVSFDYEQVFPQLTGAVASDFLESLADWLGVLNQFRPEAHYKKQSHLPLHETIENFDQVIGALRDTKFAYCLEDERGYSDRHGRSGY